MQVKGFVAAVVPDLDVASVVLGLPYLDDGAVADRHDRGSAWCGIVDGRMRFPGLGDRVKAFKGESGGDACER